MFIERVTERKSRFLIAGALALLSQGALSDEQQDADRLQPVVKVTAPSQQIEVASPKLGTDLSYHQKVVDQQHQEDLERSLQAISPSRIELVIAEVPTRG